MLPEGRAQDDLLVEVRSVEGPQDLTPTHHEDAVAHAQQLLELR